MIRQLRRTVTLVSALVLISLTARAADVQDFVGTYTYAGSPAERKAVDAEVDRVTVAFPVAVRESVRSQLKGGPWIPKRLRIAVVGDTLGIQKDDQPIHLSKMDGTPLAYTEKGRTTRVSRKWEADALSDVARTDDGVRTLMLRLSDGNAVLTVSATVESRQFKSPFRYTATFQRVADGAAAARR